MSWLCVPVLLSQTNYDNDDGERTEGYLSALVLALKGVVTRPAGDKEQREGDEKGSYMACCSSSSTVGNSKWRKGSGMVMLMSQISH